MLFLWNIHFTDTNREIKLEFYDSSSERFKRFDIRSYKPYFLTSPPLSKEGEEAVEQVQGETRPVKRRTLFTDEVVPLLKVEAWTPTFLKKLAPKFGNIWEREIDYGQSYIYDTDLVFGARHTQQNSTFELNDTIKPELKQKFENTFAQEKKTTPLKYLQIKRWFTICHQPVPEVDIRFLGREKPPENHKERIYLAFMLARIANIPVPEAYASRRVSDWIKSIIYTYLRKNHILIPTSTELRRGQQTHRVPGALTIEPKAGIYFNTVVCDFESLYPSCIDAYNLSYETVDCRHEECKDNTIPEIKHHVCTKRKGFYSLLIGALKDLRIRWFKPLAEKPSIPKEERRVAKATSKLLKLISVSSYGVTIRIHGLACPPLAESITGYGRWALRTAWKVAEEKGLQPTYGDTDSIFLDNPSAKQVQSLIQDVKNQLRLDLAIEKHYNLCVLSKAKKAYFGITKDGHPDLKGLTAIKSNAPKFIQNVFSECVKALSNVKNMEQYIAAKKEIINIVRKAIKNLHDRKVTLEDLTYAVRLYHDPNERASTTKIMPQPYQCALQLIDAGEPVRRHDTVHYIKVTPFPYKGKIFTVKPVSHVKNAVEINAEDYIRNLTTALEQTFEPMEIRLDEDMKLTRWF